MMTLCRRSKMKVISLALTVGAFAQVAVTAQETAAPVQAYSVSAGDLSITDEGTGYADVATMFNGENFIINAALVWEALEVPADAELTTLYEIQWSSTVDGKEVANGVEQVDLSVEQPASLDAGITSVSNSGSHTVVTTIQVVGQSADSATSSERTYQSFNSGASFVPLIIILLLAMTTHEVYISLGLGVFVGSCMVYGTVREGFKKTLDEYILGALADIDHGYVYLFTLFMSGFVGILEKSGGIIGFTRWISRFATTPRAGQIASFCTCLLIFFDDYANMLIAGPSMMPMYHSLTLSAEKLAFMVDGTAAPVASLTPVSSWVGFEVSLIQAELDKLNEQFPEGLTIVNSGFGVFLETIAYRYYPIFQLMLIPLLIVFQRDFGPMIVAERKSRVYGRHDGGPGSTYAAELTENQEGGGESNGPIKSKNAPEDDTPLHAVNFLVPVVFLIFYVFYFLIRTGQDGSGTQSFTDIMQGSDSYSALLWGTMASSCTAMALYFIQFKKDGKFAWPTLGTFIPDTKCTKACADADAPKFLMSWREGLTALLTGMEHVFLALVLLTLAWAFGTITRAVGLDRFFSNLIVGGDFSAAWLPTISFIVSAFIAFATGSSWSTMTIMFPLLLVPTYIKSNGDPVIFYATTAGVLSGSVAGDQSSPVSDTTVISSMSTGCQLLAHVRTQAPIVLIQCVWVCCVATIPVGLESYSNAVAMIMGLVMQLITVFLFAAPTISATGRFDIFTEFGLLLSKDPDLLQLKKDTVTAFETGEPVMKEGSTTTKSADGPMGVDPDEEGEDALLMKVKLGDEEDSGDTSAKEVEDVEADPETKA